MDLKQLAPCHIAKCETNSSGFTLLELLIVIAIVGVLAAVAVPIYSSNVEYAIRSEGEATLGSIRTQVQIYYGEWGEYPIAPLSRIIDQDWHDIKPQELDGHNFSRLSYYYQCTYGKTYLIGLHRGEVMDMHRSLNQDGVYEDWDVKVDE
jgi:prepilin-type N-terminal cleavage/methylation domain-containing protein